MKKNSSPKMAKGFTLIELIVTIVIMGIGAVAVTGMVSNIFKNRQSKRDTSVNTALAQECAELVLSQSRMNYASIATTNCNTMSLSGYAVPTITAVTAGNSTTGSSADWSSTDWGACPYNSGTNCTLLKVSSGGQMKTSLLLVSH
jgi:prepilin-type N-terminal cleavage/methylation domain-containing protein